MFFLAWGDLRETSSAETKSADNAFQCLWCSTSGGSSRTGKGGLAIYVVVAEAEQHGPPPVPPVRGQAPRGGLVEPVGTQHAVARMLGVNSKPIALCGADVSGWQLFAHLEFSPGHPAGCQRCAQLIHAATAGREARRAPARLGSPRSP